MARDFTTISPTARSLLFLKARAGIPYARPSAELLWGPLGPALDPAPDLKSRLIQAHFTDRYWSVDRLARATGFSTFVELSSGFSFRGLDFTRDPQIWYLDTDLPGVVETKQALVQALFDADPNTRPESSSRWTLEPLNVLDGEAFGRLATWGAGPLCVLNEGLLVYLDEVEKRQLCDHVRTLLARRGGCWVTGDVYVRLPSSKESLVVRDEATARFHAEHHIEENKFDDFASAEAFFGEAGLKVTAGASREPGTQVFRQTWRLEVW